MSEDMFCFSGEQSWAWRAVHPSLPGPRAAVSSPRAEMGLAGWRAPHVRHSIQGNILRTATHRLRGPLSSTPVLVHGCLSNTPSPCVLFSLLEYQCSVHCSLPGALSRAWQVVGAPWGEMDEMGNLSKMLLGFSGGHQCHRLHRFALQSQVLIEA